MYVLEKGGRPKALPAERKPPPLSTRDYQIRNVELQASPLMQCSMPTSRITIDGLWRCLCPSFGNTTFRRVGPSIAHSAARKGTDLNKERRNYQVRSLHLTSAHFTPPHAPKVIGDTSVRLDHDEPVERIIGVYDKLSISDLHEHWNYLKAKPAKYHDFTFLVDYLVRIRGEKPSLWLYNILIYANADPRIGSAATVKTLLEEMKEQGIGADSALHHTVLQVRTLPNTPKR